MKLRFDISGGDLYTISGGDLYTIDIEERDLRACESLEEAIEMVQYEVDYYVRANIVGIPDDADVEALWKEARA